MSTKNLDVNLTDGANYNAGQVGENRAVELFIHVPQDMYSLDHNYRLVFSNGVVTPMLQITPPGNDGEDGVIRYLLESELTSSSNLGMQLEEYGEDGLIDKSSVVSLKFGSSLTKQKEIFFNKDIILEINNNTIFAQKHQSTLDSLSVIDGKLFVDGKPIVGVVVWHIVDDPVNVPSMDDGTLLFISPGINGDMSYPPYKVLVLGAVVTKIAPWKPGQLWVCRGGVWYLLATANRQEYTPEEVVPDEVLPEDSDIPQDVGGSVPAEEEVYEVDPCENVDKSGGIVEAVKTLRAKAHTHSNLEALEKVELTDDVVLLPFGESINLSIRVILEEAHFYLTGREGESLVYSAEIISTDGRHINLTCGNGECYAKYTNGSNVFKYVDSWERISGTEELPNLKGFTIERFSDGYSEADNIDHLKQDYVLFDKFKTFCQCFIADTTPDYFLTNFNGLYTVENRVEALGRWVFCDNRSYVSRIDAVSFYVDAGARYVGDFIVDGYSVLYIDLARDCDVVINNISFYVGGEVPNTKAGKHKWIFNEMPKGSISLGALDLEAVV